MFRGRSVGLCVGRSVGASACPVHCGKTADLTRMPFGIIGRTSPGMRQVLEFVDRSTGRGTLGANFGRAIQPMGTLRRTCATVPRHGPLPKLLWADLLYSGRNAHIVVRSRLKSTGKSITYSSQSVD